MRRTMHLIGQNALHKTFQGIMAVTKQGLGSQVVHMQSDGLVIEETDIHKTMWAICHIPKGIRVQCQGWLGSRESKCKKNIKNTGAGAVAPSLWGVRTWERGNETAHNGRSKAQYMWFCNNSVDHTWRLCNSINQCPARVPSSWPLERGTNLMYSKLQELEIGGFTFAKVEVTESTNIRYRTGVSIQAAKRIELAVTMEAQILQHTVVKPHEHEEFVLETSSSQVRGERYEIATTNLNAAAANRSCKSERLWFCYNLNELERRDAPCCVKSPYMAIKAVMSNV
ncbi:hypothetical protein L7F22_035306 [Adiantum nelumboides]|nr:hypothetical protein [Adiantum nelumboides]